MGIILEMWTGCIPHHWWSFGCKPEDPRVASEARGENASFGCGMGFKRKRVLGCCGRRAGIAEALLRGDFCGCSLLTIADAAIAWIAWVRVVRIAAPGALP